jgi:glycerophosphoryl diester phosphodiesterase
MHPVVPPRAITLVKTSLRRSITAPLLVVVALCVTPTASEGARARSEPTPRASSKDAPPHARNADKSPRISVQGHRGARARFPENTLPAFRHAIAVGADVIELDVVATSDDVLAVMHDPVVNEQLCTWIGIGEPVRPFVVRAHTYAELRTNFDCGAKQNPRFPTQTPVPGTPVPTLDEVLALLLEESGRTVHANIEAKSVPARTAESPPPDRFARLIVDVVAKNGLTKRAIVQSFDHDVLRAVARIAPSVRRAALVDQTHVDAVAVAKAARATIYSPHHEWITDDDVKALKRARIDVVPWTANAPEEWERLDSLAVSGIITDDPEALIAWLAARASQSKKP